MKAIQKAFSILLFGVFFTGALQAQYSNIELTDPTEIFEEITHYKMHPDSVDTLISGLHFDIEVYIEDKERNRSGASRQRNSNGYRSVLDSLGGISIDRSRMRGDSVTLVIFVPSKKNPGGQPTLRGITTTFSPHFNPTATSTRVIGNRGIEFRYFFKNGLQDLPPDHDNHFIDDKGIKSHVAGHVCDPANPNC